MKKITALLYRFYIFAFFDFFTFVRALPFYLRDYIQYVHQDTKKRFSTNIVDSYPCLTDKTQSTDFEPHYLYHPAWAARVISTYHPKKHIDISSTLHFSALLSAFVPVEFYDYRPANLYLSHLVSKRADLMHLPFKSNSIGSLSCMHVIEHIGLGRYGDPIDPDGDIKAVEELKRVTKKNGNLLFVVPVGKPRLMFNAHRIYSHKQILKLFHGFRLKEHVLIPDHASKIGMIKKPSEKIIEKQQYGCGCYWFMKI